MFLKMTDTLSAFCSLISLGPALTINEFRKYTVHVATTDLERNFVKNVLLFLESVGQFAYWLNFCKNRHARVNCEADFQTFQKSTSTPLTRHLLNVTFFVLPNKECKSMYRPSG